MRKQYPVKPPVSIGGVYEHSCYHCNGSGQEPDLEDLTCRECIGRGRRRWRIEACEVCRGSGRAPKTLGLLQCKNCEGRGWNSRDVG